MKSLSFYRIFSVIAIAVTLTGCMFDYTPASLKEESHRPIVLAVAYDVSKSTQGAVPEITPFIIDTLLSLVRHRTGEFGFTTIGEAKPRMISLRFMSENGDIREHSRRQQLNDRQLSRVRREVYECIRERSDIHTRLFDSIELSLTFLSEPHLPADADKYLVVVSDFDDDMRLPEQRQPLQVPENITVLALGAEPLTIEKVLTPAPNVIAYTSLDGIIHYLNQERHHEQQ
ncbi:MAG: hypothetical protein KDH97_03335 [Calditrichaeota bacterium]|nr:hypothetical protein [Calditrichota bacterium]MCB9090514.1 hypothetical protein [Calditrichia bacterium]MCB0289268.1 hypothetical protein [Calditrichota bacterium]MCB0294629.1 hypothetical protein [Calditrichota bacterium]MCB0302162.1 hypothetical protein [Calditrichota bacterium]